MPFAKRSGQIMVIKLEAFIHFSQPQLSVSTVLKTCCFFDERNVDLQSKTSNFFLCFKSVLATQQH